MSQIKMEHLFALCIFYSRQRGSLFLKSSYHCVTNGQSQLHTVHVFQASETHWSQTENCLHTSRKLLFDVVCASDVKERSQSSADRFSQLHMAPPHCLTASVQHEGNTERNLQEDKMVIITVSTKRTLI